MLRILECGDMSPLLKRGHVRALQNATCYRRAFQTITAPCHWPHGPTHWLFEPGSYIVTAGTYQKLPHLHSPLRRDFFLKSLFDYAIEFQWEFARLGGVGQSLSLRRGVIRACQSAKIPGQASRENGQATQSLGQHARSKGVVSVLGEPYHIRTRIFGAAKLCPL
jgi:hypothetical protein